MSTIKNMPQTVNGSVISAVIGVGNDMPLVQQQVISDSRGIWINIEIFVLVNEL